MFSMRNEKYLVGLLLMISINLIYNISVTESQSTSKRNQVLGVNKKDLNKDKQKVTNAPKVKKDTESETQRAIEEIIETETTTLAIDFRLASNETINETLNEFEGNSTSNQSLLMFNETEITTPLFISSNVTTNDSLVSITVETPDYSNGTEYELLVNSMTQLTANYTNDTTLPPIGYNITDTTEMEYSETPTEVMDTLKESPILSSTISAVEAFTQSSIELDNRLNQEMAKCVFDKQIECKNYEIICFGSGEVDCGQRRKRSAQQLINENITDPEVFKSYLEKQSLSENIDNSKCVITAFENMYFACEPLPLINDCYGKSICKLSDESNDLNEGLPFWKVGLIAALTAIGAICFIIVAVIAYVSYNKLKIRPESSTNGYHNNPQNVTRV